MSETYKINIAGCERELQLCAVNDNLSIAAFILFGDVEVTIASAKALIEKCPDFDFVITPEAKSIPIAYEIARQSGKPYIVARKRAKVYMKNPVSVNVQSITTKSDQELIIDGADGERMRGKRVLIVDDVISTGESLAAVEKLLAQFDPIIVAKAAILAEGDATQRDDIVYLEKLPLFFKGS